MLEIERKAHIKNKLELFSQLKAKAQYKGFSRKKDVYFCPRHLKKVDLVNDPVFRVRQDEKKTVVCFKKQSWNKETNVNEEIEFTLEPGENIFLFAEYIQYHVLVEKVKETELFLYKGANVELNTVHGLGDYIEVEVMSQSCESVESAIALIDEIFNEFCIPKENVEPRLYIEMLMEKARNPLK